MKSDNRLNFRLVADSSAIVGRLRAVTRSSRVWTLGTQVARFVSGATAVSSSGRLVARLLDPSDEDLSSRVARVAGRSVALVTVERWFITASESWQKAAARQLLRNLAERFCALSWRRRFVLTAWTAIVAILTFMRLMTGTAMYHGLGGVAILFAALGLAMLSLRTARRAKSPE